MSNKSTATPSTTSHPGGDNSSTVSNGQICGVTCSQINASTSSASSNSSTSVSNVTTKSQNSIRHLKSNNSLPSGASEPSQALLVYPDGTVNCDKLPNHSVNYHQGHYYSPMLNGEQSLLRPIMTAQPPLYSPLLSAQQHTYAMPHPSPGTSFPNLSEALRNNQAGGPSCLSNLNEAIRNNLGEACSLEGSFKDNNAQARQSTTNDNIQSTKPCTVQENRQCGMELVSKRLGATQNENAYNNFVYGACNSDFNRATAGHDHRSFDDYGRNGWETQMGSCSISGSSASAKSLHHQCYPYPYPDCRLDPAWNKSMTGMSVTPCINGTINDGFIHEQSVAGNSSKSTNHRSVVNNSNVTMNTTDIARSYECQGISPQVPPFIPYLTTLNTQQEIRNDQRSSNTRYNQNNGIPQQPSTSTLASSNKIAESLPANQPINNLPSTQHHQTTSSGHLSASTSHSHPATHQQNTSVVAHQNNITTTHHNTACHPQNLTTHHQNISNNNSNNLPQNLSNHSHNVTSHQQHISNHSHSSSNHSQTQSNSTHHHSTTSHSQGPSNQSHTTVNHIHQPVNSCQNSEALPQSNDTSRHHSNITYSHHVPNQSSSGQHLPLDISNQKVTNLMFSHPQGSNRSYHSAQSHQPPSFPDVRQHQVHQTVHHQSVHNNSSSHSIHSNDSYIQMVNHNCSSSHHLLSGTNQSTINNNNHTSTNSHNTHTHTSSGSSSSTSIPDQIALCARSHSGITSQHSTFPNERIDSQSENLLKTQSVSEQSSTSHHSNTNNSSITSSDLQIPTVPPIDTIGNSLSGTESVQCDETNIKKSSSSVESGTSTSQNLCLVCGCPVNSSTPASDSTSITGETSNPSNIESHLMQNNNNGQSMIDHLLTVGSKMSVADKLSFLRGSPLPREFLGSQSICSKCFHLVNEIDLLEHKLSFYRKDLISKLETSLDRMGHRVSGDLKKQANLNISSGVCQQQAMAYQHHNHLHQQTHNNFFHEDSFHYLPSQIFQSISQDHHHHNTDQHGHHSQVDNNSNQSHMQHRLNHTSMMQQQNLLLHHISAAVETMQTDDNKKSTTHEDNCNEIKSHAKQQHQWKNETSIHTYDPNTPASTSSAVIENKITADCEIDIEECDNLAELTDNSKKNTTCTTEPSNDDLPTAKPIIQENDVSSTDGRDCSIKESTTLINNQSSDINIEDDKDVSNPVVSANPQDCNENSIVASHDITFLEMPSMSQDRLLEDATEYHKPTLLGKNIKTKKHAKLQICRQCDRVFSNRQALDRHIERRHKSYAFPYNCDTCHKKFNSEKSLFRHAQQHKQKMYTCKICKEIFLQKDKLKSHLKEHTQKSLICDYCEKVCSSLAALISHVKTHTKPKQIFKCDTCNECFANQRNLNVHFRHHTGEKPYACKNCKKSFSTQSNMVAHQKICMKQDVYTCSQCNKIFSLQSLYKRHLEEHAGRFSHLCSVCGKGYSKASKLQAHMLTHNPQKPKYTCQICGTVLTSKSGYTSHMDSHTGKTSVLCPVCGKRLARKSQLTDHLAKHSNTRSYQCPHCSSSFFYKSNMIHHIRSTHQQLRPFNCSYCNKNFSSSNSYKQHLRIHTNERPFQCKACGKAFNTKGNYSRHLRCHHQRTNNIEEVKENLDL